MVMLFPVFNLTWGYSVFDVSEEIVPINNLKNK